MTELRGLFFLNSEPSSAEKKPRTFGLAYATTGLIEDELFPDSEMVVPENWPQPEQVERVPDVCGESAIDFFLCRNCSFVSGSEQELRAHFSAEHHQDLGNELAHIKNNAFWKIGTKDITLK